MAIADPVPAGYGIDFGTSNSAIAVAYPGQVRLVEVESAGDPILPSRVYLHRDGSRLAGEEARRRFGKTGHRKTDCWRCPLAPYGWDTDCRQYRKGGGCNDARLLSGLKHDIAKPGFSGTNSWAVDFGVPDLVAVVLRRLKQAADASCGADVRRVVLGHPVVFAGAAGGEGSEDHRLALGRLREAALTAGFEEVQMLPEPAAAIIGERQPPGVTLAADFGGGTFDAAVMDGRGPQPSLAALTGVPVGGDRLDGVLFEVRAGPALGLESLPSWLYNEMRTPATAALLMADPGLPGLLQRLGTPAARTAAAILLEGQADELYRKIEAVKVRLSAEGSVSLRHRAPGVELDTVVHRGAFESMIRPELDLVRATVLEALDRAGLVPSQVDTVLLTGGSSQIPAFRRDLEALFGSERLHHRDAFTAVVRGLGVHAAGLWADGARAPEPKGAEPRLP